ncbi:MAG: type II secretion system F family protein [Thomasclavelia ramosa]
MQDTMMVLNNQFTNDNKIKNKVKSAMTYPVILGIVTIVVLLIVYTAVLPSFFSMFEGMELPLIT